MGRGGGLGEADPFGLRAAERRVGAEDAGELAHPLPARARGAESNGCDSEAAEAGHNATLCVALFRGEEAHE